VKEVNKTLDVTGDLSGMSADDLRAYCRRLEEEKRYLTKNLDLYHTMLNNTGTSILLIEEDMTISMANDRFLCMMGLTADSINQLKWTDLIPPAERERMVVQHRLRRQNSSEALNSYEFKYLSKTGTPGYAMINIMMVPGTSKSVASLIDITARKQAERKLQASEEKFRILAEFSPFAILMHQGDHWIYANRAAMDISGYTEEEILAMNYWDIAHPDDRELIRLSGKKRQRGEVLPVSYEFRIMTKTGEMKWVSLTGKRIEYEEKPTALIAVIDITDRKNHEVERGKLERQLQQAQKMESVGRLAGGVAHDFNNMLSVILGHVELALYKTEPDAPIHTHLREIGRAADRSANLTRQLLAFARKQTVAPEVLDLNETMAGMLSMLERLIGEDIDLVWNPGSGLWPVRMDPTQIDQILANLCINARDAIAGVGKMTIEAENVTIGEDYAAAHAGFITGDFVRIAVSDDGCGIDKEHLPLIFEPFFTTKEINQGTGLGLATVYGAVKQNKGFINAYSEPGQGTTITLYFPRHKGKNEPLVRRNVAPDIAQGNETILLVEDEPSILEVATLLLESQGYKVLAAATPGEALRIAGEHRGEIDLVLTDVVMPEMNGRDLARNLLTLYPQIRPLFMSGYTANVIAHQGVLDEGVHFIQKPFSAHELAAKVRDALDGDSRA
jgi:PAS domain S-box-containing protein